MADTYKPDVNMVVAQVEQAELMIRDGLDMLHHAIYKQIGMTDRDVLAACAKCAKCATLPMSAETLAVLAKGVAKNAEEIKFKRAKDGSMAVTELSVTPVVR